MQNFEMKNTLSRLYQNHSDLWRFPENQPSSQIRCENFLNEDQNLAKDYKSHGSSIQAQKKGSSNYYSSKIGLGS